MTRTIGAAVLGAVLGMIVSLLVFGDDGPGLEPVHIIMVLAGLVVAVLAQRALDARSGRH